jgi:hypothetical protein
LLRRQDLSEIPKSQKRSKPKSLGYYERNMKTRNAAIYESYKSGGYSMKGIADYYNLHYSWVSRLISEADKAKNKT